MRLVLYSAVALTCLFAASSASACGESLFRVGKGVSYREYQAPLPGNILMVARSADDHIVAEWLANTGHNVQLVESTDRLAEFLSKGRFDVVLASFKERDAVAAQEARAGSKAKFIPVAAETPGEEELARAQYKQALTDDASPRDLLKAIHKTMKSDSNIKGM
jgi:hypothetical protein